MLLNLQRFMKDFKTQDSLSSGHKNWNCSNFLEKETCISQIKLVPCQKHSTFVCLLSHLLALSASFRTAKQDCVFTALLHCRRRSGQRNKSVCLRLFQNRHKTDIQNRHKILFQFLFVPIFVPTCKGHSLRRHFQILVERFATFRGHD